MNAIAHAGPRLSPSRGTRAPLWLLVSALAAACGTEAGDGSDPSRMDGAPVAIEPVPLVSVGVLEGDPMQEFDEVAGAFLTPAGELVVVTGQELRVFDVDGAFVRSLGGQGEGPGEFTGLRDAWARGDTIEAWDSRARRITRFVPGGGIETIPLGGSSVPLDRGLGPLGEGWAVTTIRLGDPRDVMAAFLIGRDGEHLGDVAPLDGMERYQAGGLIGPHPITPTALYRVHGDEVFAAETLTPVIRVHRPPDTTVVEVPLPLASGADPATAFEQVLAAFEARAENPEGGAAMRERLAAFPPAGAVSRFWSFLVDDEGFVWVRPYDPTVHALVLGGRPDGSPGPGGEWLVVSRDGAEVARITMPSDLEPRQITAEAVVGIARDELGVETVRVHRLVRR